MCYFPYNNERLSSALHELTTAARDRALTVAQVCGWLFHLQPGAGGMDVLKAFKEKFLD
jgi:hypothetical protein